MLAQRPGCCRAVQRQFRAQADAIWITDDILLKVLKSFSHNRYQPRRNGSSIPGPMECRRREGKRRMTHLSQAAPAHPAAFEGLWAFGSSTSKDQWQWEPPATRPLPVFFPPPPPPTLFQNPMIPPMILAEPQSATLEDEAGTTETVMHIPTTAYSGDTTSAFIFRFRNDINGAPWAHVEEMCVKFTRKMKESLILGIVSSVDLERSVDAFYNDVFRAAESRAQSDIQCLSLYRAIWEGLESCHMSNPELIGCQALKLLSRTLAHIELLPEAQDLALKMIRTVPDDQHHNIQRFVAFLVRYWSRTFQKTDDFTGPKLHYNSLMVDKSDQNPLIGAVQSVARFIDQLPPYLAQYTIRRNTESLMKSFVQKCSQKGYLSSKDWSRIRYRRYFWMLTLANARCVSDDLLIETWKIVNKSSDDLKDPAHRLEMPRISHIETCLLLLDHLISQSKITREHQIKNDLTHKLRNRLKPIDSAILFKTLGVNFSGMATVSFIRILAQLDSPGAIRETLQLLRHDGTRLRESRIISMIRDVSRTHPRDAFEIYRAHYYLSSGLYDPLKLEQFPGLVVALIHHPDTNPDEIWGHLQKGLLLRLRRNSCRLPFSSKILSPKRIILLYKMAEAFATAKNLSNSVAFRNVIRCATYLRRYGVPLNSNLSRTMTQAGLIRSLEARRWPGMTKGRWVLKVIENGEGPEVAHAVDAILCRWRAASYVKP